MLLHSLNNSVSRASSSSIALGRLANDSGIEKNWSAHQRWIAVVIGHRTFEAALGLMVCFSLMLAIIDSDHRARGSEAPVWCKTSERILLLGYCIEMTLRIYLLRLHLFTTPLNVIDFSVVAVDAILLLLGLAIEELPNVGFMRVLRLLKLSRAFHLVRAQPQLYILVEGLLGSMQTIFYGSVFIAVAITIYSILAVEFLHPLADVYGEDCARCPRAFASVFESMCTMFQTIVVGDSWGDFFLPLFERYPATMLPNLFFFAIINFGIMNLIMAVIVDSAAQARIQNTKVVADEKAAEFETCKKKLVKMCKEMDTDGSGNLTIDEMMSGYESHVQFRNLISSMDVSKEDIKFVFSILDEDKSGDVGYTEFMEQLHKMKANDSHTLLVFIKHYVTDLEQKMTEELRLLKGEIAGGIQKIRQQSADELALLRKLYVPAGSGLLVTPTVPASFEAGLGDLTICPEPALSASFANGDGDYQIQCSTAQIAATLDQLRLKCESSAALLNTFHISLQDLTSGCGSKAPAAVARKSVGFVEDSSLRSVAGCPMTNVSNGWERMPFQPESLQPVSLGRSSRKVKTGKSSGLCAPSDICAASEEKDCELRASPGQGVDSPGPMRV